MMLGKSQRDGVKKIFVSGNENGALLLGVGKQLVVCDAGRKDFQSVNGGVSGGLQLGEGRTRKIFVEEKVHALNWSGYRQIPDTRGCLNL